MRKLLSVLFFLLTLTLVQAQVSIDNSFDFSPGTGRIEQLAYPIDSTSAANAATTASGVLHFALATGSSSIFNLTVNPDVPTYIDGMTITFVAPVTAGDSLLVKLNSLPAIPIHKDYQYPLDSGDLTQGQAVQLLYSAGKFNLISQIQKNCPSGFIHVNEKYCIQDSESIPSNYYDAVVNCSQLGARLCSWGEWYYACQKSGLNLTAMTNNYEWTDDLANEDGSLRVTGAGSCTTIAAGLGTNSYSYRCCYSK